MFSTDDTIVAISTPVGRAGLGVVRVAGPDAAAIGRQLTGRSRPLTPRRATFARVSQSPHAGGLPQSSGAPPADEQGPPLERDSAITVGDQVVVTFFPAPRSSTGDDVVEISAHGSPVVLQGIVRAAMAAGARLAQPGEFTLRAFLNGKLDLVQAEAVADLIDAVTPRQARAAFDQLEGTLTTRIREIETTLFDLIARLEASLDFPDEGYHFVTREAAGDECAAIAGQVDALLDSANRGRIIREGAQVAIVGTPNVGKSSLFNALLNTSRAIVTPIPGTTRDLLTERAEVRGMAVSLVDTAGITDSDDVVEREGVSRARQAMSVADVSLVVLDLSRPLRDDDLEIVSAARLRRHLLVANKSDLPPAWTSAELDAEVSEISAQTGHGLDPLLDALAAALGLGRDHRDSPLVSNVRHIELLARARTAIGRATNALKASNGGVSEEFVLADLQDASAALQEVTGERRTDELLQHIFSRFCIGK
jgi:tRNA modification GTPase